MRGDLWIIALVLSVGLAALLMNTDDTTNVELQNYCEMREIYRDSGAEYGWPARAHSKFDDGDCE